MRPEIITHSSLKLVGLTAPLRTALDTPNNMAVIPHLWQVLMPQLPSLKNRHGGERFALITGDLPDTREPAADYHALIQVSDIAELPDNFVSLEFEDLRLARFPYKGPPQGIGHAAYQILKNWLPESGEVLAHHWELIVYPSNYDRNNPESELSYCLSLKSR